MSTQSSVVLPDPAHTLYLIDISSFIFRAFFAIRSLRNQAGEPTNAVYGVATMLARLAEEAKPDYLAVVYDSKEASFRKEIYPEYKANRTEAPDDLKPQFAMIETLIQRFEIHSYRQKGIEADDLIATLTRRWSEASPKNKVIVVSNDKDLMQLVTPKVNLWDTMSNKIYGPAEVIEKFGVKPEQIRDYLALVGDSSDNIPGVPSIGPKSASDLLRDFGDLEQILKAAKQGKIPGKKGETLKTHEADARLSADLATVRDELPVEIPMDSLKYHFHVTDQCLEFLKEMDFHSLVKKWKDVAPNGSTDSAAHSNSNASTVSKTSPASTSSTAHPTSPASAESTLSAPSVELVRGEVSQDSRFRMINSEKAFKNLLNEMERKKEFGFDLETTSLNPREAQIVGLAICCDSEAGYYIPVGHRDSETAQLSRDWVLKTLRPFLEDPKLKKIGQNLKYDWSVLIEHGFNPAGIGADTMVAAYILEPEGRHNLEKLASHYLGYQTLNFEDVCGKGKDQLCFDQVSVEKAARYSAEDAWVAMELWKKLEPMLHSENLMDVFQRVDLPLVPILAKMELNGVCIDEVWFQKLSNEFGHRLHEIEGRVQVFTNGPINLNSPKQLGQLLFNDLKLPTQGKTKTGFSTDASVLEALAPLHEVPRLLLEYREISKLKGTYVDPLPLSRDPKTGKIHASFHQTVAATGRLSSSDPNLQNIPIRSDRGMKIRKGFIPSEGCVLLSADYSQIELRLLAHMSGDPELTRAFMKNEDVHQRTAGDIFNIPVEKVDDHQRSIAKAINFGLMYGKTVFGLAQELKIPRKEAQLMIHNYFTRYESVKKFLDSEVAGAREKGFVTTLLGRKRRLPDIHSKNAGIRANSERMAMNAPIQGTAADLIKLAMIELDRRLEKEGFQSKLTIQVHDEVVLDCPKKEVKEVQKLVTEVMENALSLSVPLRVNSTYGDNWMDL